MQYRVVLNIAKADESVVKIPTYSSEFPKLIQHYVIVLLRSEIVVNSNVVQVRAM